jgi:hypothetical protein
MANTPTASPMNPYPAPTPRRTSGIAMTAIAKGNRPNQLATNNRTKYGVRTNPTPATGTSPFRAGKILAHPSQMGPC